MRHNNEIDCWLEILVCWHRGRRMDPKMVLVFFYNLYATVEEKNVQRILLTEKYHDFMTC